MEDTEGDLCSYRSVRKVIEVNHHKGKEQLMAAYRNADWMSRELSNIIDPLVNDCKICQKFQRSVVRPRVSLPELTSFNEIVTLDLKEFGKKYIVWMIDTFTRFIQGY